ncbi:MAG: sigma-70 family RNA polymerase sigma factor [Verrucomicrobia bacterium]|nr:sigma-70 family RNA polymerase sigma factor [Verrucomicrobiota bacterium]
MNADSPSAEDPRALPETPIFATTRWTVVVNAGDSRSPEQSDALAQLCSAYWYPVYAYIRRHGASVEDAKDLTQEFFARLLAQNFLDRADREKGKFRWFLLGAVRHFLSAERRREAAAKRGGGQSHVPLDELLAEKKYRLEPATTVTPEKLFERSWAMTLLQRVREQLREHYAQAGKLERFTKLETFIPGSGERRSYAEVGAELGLSEGALRVELTRLKQTYRKLLRTEIAHTVSTPAEIDEELRHLIEVMQD